MQKRPGPGRPKVGTTYGEAFLVFIKDNGFELSKSTATNLFLLMSMRGVVKAKWSLVLRTQANWSEICTYLANQ